MIELSNESFTGLSQTSFIGNELINNYSNTSISLAPHFAKSKEIFNENQHSAEAETRLNFK